MKRKRPACCYDCGKPADKFRCDLCRARVAAQSKARRWYKKPPKLTKAAE